MCACIRECASECFTINDSVQHNQNFLIGFDALDLNIFGKTSGFYMRMPMMSYTYLHPHRPKYHCISAPSIHPTSETAMHCTHDTHLHRSGEVSLSVFREHRFEQTRIRHFGLLFPRVVLGADGAYTHVWGRLRLRSRLRVRLGLGLGLRFRLRLRLWAALAKGGLSKTVSSVALLDLEVVRGEELKLQVRHHGKVRRSGVLRHEECMCVWVSNAANVILGVHTRAHTRMQNKSIQHNTQTKYAICARMKRQAITVPWRAAHCAC